MNLISAESLSKSYDGRFLFKDLNFGLSEGDKMALVGANGTGKTTFMRTLAGLQAPDDGNVSNRKGLRMYYLEQQPELDGELTVGQVIFSEDNPVATAVQAYEQALLMESTSGEEMQDLLERMTELDAWDFENRSHQVLAKLSITDLSQKVGSLSGGQKKRVALAQLVLSDPDLIMLDEPTNHLDLEAIEWLEGYLRSAQTTILMVTHDRYFLDAVTNSISELDQGVLYRYQGNYAYFLEKKSERMANEKVQVERARNLYTKELEWMRRQPRARGTKAKYRIEAFDDIKEKAFKNLKQDQIQLQVQATRQGGKVMELHHVNKAFAGKKMLDNFSYTFRKGDRVGLVGKNGVGKTTFLNLITQRIAPDTGEILPGQTTRAGYYAQEVDNLNVENRIIDEVKEIAEFVTLADGSSVSVSKLLDMFLFPPSRQHGYIHKLSGGERRRLQLLKVLVDNPNFLILDEPTNDLDIDTLNVLEQFLTDFPGCLVLVSHDRYFMDHLVEHLFVFEGDGKVRDYPGNYSDYRSWLDEQEALPSPSNKTQNGMEKTATAAPVSTKKLGFKEQKELEDLPGKMEGLEKRKQILVAEMSNGPTFERLDELGTELTALDKEIEKSMDRWLELEN